MSDTITILLLSSTIIKIQALEELAGDVGKLEIEAGADPKERHRMEAIRFDWGRMLSQFLDNSEDS